MKCYKCATLNDEDAVFCYECGAQLKTNSLIRNCAKKVVLVDCGKNKMQTIKQIRRFTNASLKEAMSLSEQLPSKLKYVFSETEANQIKDAFTAIGAVVEII